MDKFYPYKRATLVCEFHFAIGDIHVDAHGRKDLRADANPVVKQKSGKHQRKAPKDRFTAVEKSTESEFESGL